MRHHYPRSRRTLVPAALRKADTLTLEITCTVHVITSLRYFSPLLLPPRCRSWPRPNRRSPASRFASTINSTRIITTGTTTKIALGVNTSPKTTETLTNIQSLISGSNRNTGTGATPIPTIAIIKTDTSLIPSIPSATLVDGMPAPRIRVGLQAPVETRSCRQTHSFILRAIYFQICRRDVFP